MAIEDLTAPPARVRTRDDAPSGAEWSASPLRPIAHWVLMPGDRGERHRLTMVWEVPDPLPPS